MKKASLSLSINAIVVLILAVVLMAFALPFVKDLFEKTKGGIIGQFPEVNIYATAQDPIGIGNEFYIKPGQEKKMTLHVYNNLDSAISVTEKTHIQFDCGTGDKTPITEDTEKITSLGAGDSAQIKVIFRGQTGMKNNDICLIKIGASGTKIEQSFFLITK